MANKRLAERFENLEGEMKVITINVPSKWLEEFTRLQDEGLFTSRSEAIRSAIRDFMAKQREPTNFIEPTRETEDMNIIQVPNEDGTFTEFYKIGEA